MSQALLKHVQVQSKSLKKNVPVLRSGNIVKVHQKIMEATRDGMKERIQMFEGLVIAVNSGQGADSTFTVRKISYGVGVEKVFPLHSPNIAKVEIMRQAKVSRSKLYYMRDRTGKSARLKDSKLMGYAAGGEAPQEITEEAIQEAVEAVAKAEEEPPIIAGLDIL